MLAPPPPTNNLLSLTHRQLLLSHLSQYEPRPPPPIPNIDRASTIRSKYESPPPLQYGSACPPPPPLTVGLTLLSHRLLVLTSEYEPPPPPAKLGRASPTLSKYDPPSY